jgi:hypothetical protein
MPNEPCEARDSNVGSYQSLPGLLAGLAVYDIGVSKRKLAAEPLWAIEIVVLPVQQGWKKLSALRLGFLRIRRKDFKGC